MDVSMALENAEDYCPSLPEGRTIAPTASSTIPEPEDRSGINHAYINTNTSAGTLPLHDVAIRQLSQSPTLFSSARRAWLPVLIDPRDIPPPRQPTVTTSYPLPKSSDVPLPGLSVSELLLTTVSTLLDPQLRQENDTGAYMHSSHAETGGSQQSGLIDNLADAFNSPRGDDNEMECETATTCTNDPAFSDDCEATGPSSEEPPIGPHEKVLLEADHEAYASPLELVEDLPLVPFTDGRYRPAEDNLGHHDNVQLELQNDSFNVGRRDSAAGSSDLPLISPSQNPVVEPEAQPTTRFPADQSDPSPAESSVFSVALPDGAMLQSSRHSPVLHLPLLFRPSVALTCNNGSDPSTSVSEASRPSLRKLLTGYAESPPSSSPPIPEADMQDPWTESSENRPHTEDSEPTSTCASAGHDEDATPSASLPGHIQPDGNLELRHPRPSRLLPDLDSFKDFLQSRPDFTSTPLHPDGLDHVGLSVTSLSSSPPLSSSPSRIFTSSPAVPSSGDDLFPLDDKHDNDGYGDTSELPNAGNYMLELPHTLLSAPETDALGAANLFNREMDDLQMEIAGGEYDLPPSSPPPLSWSPPPANVDRTEAGTAMITDQGDEMESQAVQEAGQSSSFNDDHSAHSTFQPEELKEVSAKRKRTGSPALPNPKRHTSVTLDREHKKLIAPFRSPKPVPKKSSDKCKPSMLSPLALALGNTGVSPGVSKASSSKQDTSSAPLSAKEAEWQKIKDYTPRAAAKFKSPLASSASASSRLNAAVKFTPTIQALERKLQVLKRAVKIKEDGEQEKLDQLAAKWRESGRGIAWEVWNLVKDRAEAGDPSGSKSGGWGYDDEKKPFQSNWGWDVSHDQQANDVGPYEEEPPRSSPCDDENTDRPSDNLGTMLRQLKIDPATLGWDDAMEDFVD
ncbi:hypothetical protein PUNSTDRAFT_132423 [Punctularia strigosozonata HHB-11173 SS5]|uniref:uncharacterized protein n=1 Tax=Punctularia strigosozonata (strain HHB-11173) TaxID=741275 RepID=UPI0004417E7C|nr:uncharacterized protein PUNSTDRAFT_132423 [Punctularia strigosozonata HHB-11173 SS5]EIN10331.1 hypothetical protein PUNSTDRAFT_132423 [Punctularia strigosozonata HHB-11173 SS5]